MSTIMKYQVSSIGKTSYQGPTPVPRLYAGPHTQIRRISQRTLLRALLSHCKHSAEQLRGLS